MKKLTLVDKIAAVLQQNPEQRFITREIASSLFETYPDEYRQKRAGFDSDRTFLQQLASEIGAATPRLLKQRPKVKITESRPRKYYFTEQADVAEIDSAEGITASPAAVVGGPAIREHDLYPILSGFLLSELEVYSKRIDEKRSSNSRGAGGNKWLYPDLVGVDDLSAGWDREIRDCVQQYADKKTKLWSFEVKILINRSNVRESFFQAVSNSSWANFGYLVASEIEGPDTLKELRILSGLHGIGVIQLEAESPSESQIMIPARERDQIDWDTANRLAKENRDFLKVITLVRQFYQTGDLRKADWD